MMASVVYVEQCNGYTKTLRSSIQNTPRPARPVCYKNRTSIGEVAVSRDFVEAKHD